MENSGKERRQCFRATIAVPVKFKLCDGDETTYEGVVRNISTGGLLIELSREDIKRIWKQLVPEKSMLVIEELFISTLLVEMMTIVDIRWKSIESGKECYLVGVSFLEDNDHRTKVIREFIGLT